MVMPFTRKDQQEILSEGYGKNIYGVLKTKKDFRGASRINNLNILRIDFNFYIKELHDPMLL